MYTIIWFCVPATSQVPVRLYAADATTPQKHTSTKVVNDVCVITLDTPNAKVWS